VHSSFSSAIRLAQIDATWRNFYELATPGPSPIAKEALQHIAALYAVEKDIRGRGADERRVVRQQKSRTTNRQARPLCRWLLHNGPVFRWDLTKRSALNC
jgi:hypothetical protein